MKVALVGVNHWHVGIYYLPALKKLDAEIVAISDPFSEALERLDAGRETRRYYDYRKLLDEEDIDLVMAHAPHDQMTALAGELVARHQPFHMEKPMGIDWRELEPVATKAQAEGIFNSVALVSRYLGVIEQLVKLKQAGKLGRVRHYYYRLLGGSPHRYVEWNCGWMLDPAKAGGGPLFNFGPHLIDTFIYLTGQRIAEVRAHYIRGIYGLDIEDMVTLTMVAEDGAVGVGEGGYVMPQGYERYFSVSTDALHIGGEVAGGEIVFRDGTRQQFDGLSGDEVYFQYTSDLLKCLRTNQRPRATIQDMVETLRVINAADESARSGQPVAVGGAAQ